MAPPVYPVDPLVVTIQPASGYYNQNASSVQPSSIGTSATGNFFIEAQALEIAIWRQHLLIPTQSWVDPRNAVPVDQSFYTTPDKNRVLAMGFAGYQATIEYSATYSPANVRVTHVLAALNAASGTGGNGLYTSGYGHIQTVQPGYKRRFATSGDVASYTTQSFAFPLFERQGAWDRTIPGDAINWIVRLVALNVQSRLIPGFDPNLLYV